ncbi:MAG: domain S-box protein, partial [Devosia sp.]|nr:domain S-box protein [Devosia sp.]
MLARVVESAAVGMLVSEMSGRMVFANKAFTTLLGHQIDPDRAQNILDIIHPDDTAMARLQLRRLMRG